MFKLVARMLTFFVVLSSNGLHYFDGPTKLSSDLVKFLDF